MSGTWGPAPTPWKGHTWAQGMASPPPCVPQKSVPQKLFRVTERLFGNTKGMRGTFLYSVPKTRNKYFWRSLEWVVAVDFGDKWYHMFPGALWGHFSTLCKAHKRLSQGRTARLRTGLLVTSAFWCPLEKLCRGDTQPRACAGSGKRKTLVAVDMEHVTSQPHRDAQKSTS